MTKSRLTKGAGVVRGAVYQREQLTLGGLGAVFDDFELRVAHAAEIANFARHQAAHIESVDVLRNAIQMLEKGAAQIQRDWEAFEEAMREVLDV